MSVGRSYIFGYKLRNVFICSERSLKRNSARHIHLHKYYRLPYLIPGVRIYLPLTPRRLNWAHWQLAFSSASSWGTGRTKCLQPRPLEYGGISLPPTTGCLHFSSLSTVSTVSLSGSSIQDGGHQGLSTAMRNAWSKEHWLWVRQAVQQTDSLLDSDQSTTSYIFKIPTSPRHSDWLLTPLVTLLDENFSKWFDRQRTKVKSTKKLHKLQRKLNVHIALFHKHKPLHR